MSDEPLISIVTPSFNMGRFLERALESVHGQSDRIEHIVVDGGSTDESPTIIESWARRLAWRVSQPDRGQSDAINKGFQIARGRFGAWLNADDWYQPGALNAVVADLERDPDVDLLIGRCRFIDMEGRVVFDPKPPDPVSVESLLRLRSQWFDGRLLVQPEVFFRLALFRRVGGLDVHNHYSMDHD
ncbi:MAG: glycosyltransferase, partial [Phycisphaerales bacterium]|nr:glycosyltransferase [Phycisphaerales bacterium]